MRTMFLTLLLLADLFAGAINYPPTYYIPAGGQTLNTLDYGDIAGQTFYVTTSGAVNLGSNTYTLTYGSLPYASTSWNVILDATNLTLATTTNVNLFGITPLSTYYPIKKFYINFSVVWDAGVASKKVTYFGSIDDLKNFVGTTNFNGRVNFTDTVFLDGGKDYLKPTSGITTGQTVVALDTGGRLGYGCAPWCILGNAGIVSTTNFLGTTDSAGLNFRVNNYPSGRIDYTLSNNSLGYGALVSNTSGTANTALGNFPLRFNTTGSANTAIGWGVMTNNTTGQRNVAIGYSALAQNITGGDNIAIGYNSDMATTSTTYGVAIGYLAQSGNYGIALGFGSQAANNQLAMAGIKSIKLTDAVSSAGYVLTDSADGIFVPRALPTAPYLQGTTYTPLTGDSVSVVTQNNTINPAGTIANFTIRLPGTPTAWQIISLTSTQIITNLKWSTTLSSDADTVESHVPVALTAGQAIKIQYNSTLSKWLNY